MKILYIFLGLVAGTISSMPLYSADRDNLSSQILQLVKDGEAFTLELLMERYADRLEGRLLDVEVEQENGRIIYELEMIRNDSKVYEIKIDAQSGEWLEEKQER